MGPWILFPQVAAADDGMESTQYSLSLLLFFLPEIHSGFHTAQDYRRILL